MVLNRPLILSFVPLKDHLITIQLPCHRLAVSPVGPNGQKFEMAEEPKMVLLISLLVAAATAVVLIKKCKAAQTKDAWEEAPSRSAQTHQGHVFSVMQPR